MEGQEIVDHWSDNDLGSRFHHSFSSDTGGNTGLYPFFLCSDPAFDLLVWEKRDDRPDPIDHRIDDLESHLF